MTGEKSKSPTPEFDFWIAALGGVDHESTLETVRELVCKRKIFGFSKGGLARMSPGDRVCFHAIGIGVVADATVSSSPVNDRKLISPFYPWFINLRGVNCYTERPILLDAALRKRMDAFIGRAPDGNWTWFIKHAHRVTNHVFQLLTSSS